MMKIERSSSRSVTFGRRRQHRWDQDELSERRRRIEMMLARTQADESGAADRHDELQARLEAIKGLGSHE